MKVNISYFLNAFGFHAAYFFLFPVIVMASIDSAAESLESQHKQTVRSFLEMKRAISNYQRVPCITPIAQQQLAAIESAADRTLENLNLKYKEYMGLVGKAFDGGGEYNKTFEKVSAESAARKRVSEKYQAVYGTILGQFRRLYQAYFVSREVDSVDDTSSLDCAALSFAMHDNVLRADESIVESANNYGSRIGFEVKRFAFFQNQNSGLSENAGAISPGMSQRGSGVQAVGGEGVKGFKKGSSGISQKPEKKR